MTNVDRRIPKTQEALQTAVLQLMTEKSFEKITIQDLSDKANVSRGTFYLHYRDKYDLLDKLIDTHIEELRERCKGVANLDFPSAILTWTEYFNQHYSFFSLMLASKGATYFKNQFYNLLVEEFSDKFNTSEGKNKDFNTDLIISFLASAYAGVVEWWFTNERPVTHQALAEQLGGLLERI
ncbi:TetR/AcrR family transcriptional regulator [Paenibacillus sp. NPDC058071]|uniref:TetR/AcrR family transcriptional regulator n=1 Tax=Paenibacillus sp. NPDC058071 TaxID=3346326 RepID=UPI0036D8E1A2